jgi:TRAP-type transport system periplasmic protein
MKKKMIYSIFLILMALGLTSNMALAAAKPIKIKYAHLGPPKPFDSAIHAAAVAFKYVMEKRSAGRFQVDIYPSGTLGKEIDMMEAVKNNVIQVHAASMGGLDRIFPLALLPFSPYIFRNASIAVEVIDGPFGIKLLDAFTEKTGIKGLGILDYYSFMVITNSIKQVHTPKDMQGIKFRGMDTLQTTMFKALGASGVPIAWPETYTSLQTGVVHGQTNPAFIVSWAKLNEVQKYMTLANSQYGYQWLVCNKQWYEALSTQDRKVVHDAVWAAINTSRGLGILLEEKAIDEVRKLGMDVYALSDTETLEFQKLARPACLEWLKTKRGNKWVDELIKAVNEAEVKLGY